MTSIPSDRLFLRTCTLLHVSQREMRHSNPMHRQQLFRKTNVNFEESYKFMYYILVEYVDKRRKKIKSERERKRERRG